VFISQIQEKYPEFPQEWIDCLIAVYRRHFSLLTKLTDNLDTICRFLSLQDVKNMLSTDKGKKKFGDCLPFLSRQLQSLKPQIESIFNQLDEIASNLEFEQGGVGVYPKLSQKQREIMLKCLLDLGRLPLTIQMINDILNIGFKKTDHVNIMYTIYFILTEGFYWEFAQEFHYAIIDQLIREISPSSDLLIELLFFRKHRVLDQQAKKLLVSYTLNTHYMKIFKHYCDLHGPLKAVRLFVDNKNNIDYKLLDLLIFILRYCYINYPDSIGSVLQLLKDVMGKEKMKLIAEKSPDIAFIIRQNQQQQSHFQTTKKNET